MLKRTILIALAIVALTGCTKSDTPTSTAPDFTLRDLSGKKVSLSELKGQVVLVEFWATWCPPCRESIPGMERLHKAYHNKGLAILGVSLDTGGANEVKSFARDFGISYPILLGTEDVASLYMVRAIPTLFLVNKEGMITRQYLGGAEEAVLERDIQALL